MCNCARRGDGSRESNVSEVLDTDTAVSYPDELLQAYARDGVNGVWLQAVLYKVTRFPFDFLSYYFGF